MTTKHGKRKTVKTRDMMLILCSVLVIIYTIIDIILGFVGLKTGSQIQLDSTLTTEVFGFAKWVITTGAGITVAKTLKGRTNSDETEEPPPMDNSDNNE